jgi:hypothetical protein
MWVNLTGVVEWGLGGAAGTYQEVMDWVRYWNVYTQKKREEILTTKMGVIEYPAQILNSCPKLCCMYRLGYGNCIYTYEL